MWFYSNVNFVDILKSLDSLLEDLAGTKRAVIFFSTDRLSVRSEFLLITRRGWFSLVFGSVSIYAAARKKC